MLKKIIDEIGRAIALAVLIIVAMFVIQASNLGKDSETEDETILIDAGSTVGEVREGKSDREVSYKDDEYLVGQVWRYHTRTGEENSTVQIIGISKYPDEEAIIHISIKGLKMTLPMNDSRLTEEIGHLAFSRTAFSESVTSLVEMGEISADAEKSREDWQLEYETEGGGMFTVGIADFIELMEQGAGLKVVN